MKIIKSLFLFEGLSEKETNEILIKFEKPILFLKNDIIYSKDKYSNALGIVLNGEAAALTSNSEGIYMKSFPKGSVFGAAAVFGNDEHYISTVVAKCDTEILFITEELLREIFALYPKTALNYISFLSDKIRFLNNKLNMISSPTAEDTVYNYLLSIKDSNNLAKPPISMTLLAKMLGLGRASLYRSLDTLEAGGKIQREKNYIKVI